MTSDLTRPPMQPACNEPEPGQPGDGPDRAQSSVGRLTRGLTAVDIGAAAIGASMVALHVPLGPGLWTARIAVLLVIMPLGLLRIARSVRHRERAAILLVAFLFWAALSAAVSTAPGLALLGSVRRHGSFLILLGAACAWSFGTAVTRNGQRALGWSVVAATAFSGVIAIVRLATGSSGRAYGLAVHPVYFGAFAAASAGWFAHRLSKRVRASDLAGLAGSAFLAGLSGSRIALASVVVLAVASVVVSRRAQAWATLPVVAVGAVGALAMYRANGSTNSTLDRAGSSGLSDRLEIWSYAWRGWLDRPVLGVGPGRFPVASQPYFSDEWAVRFSSRWWDAHNVALEWLTTLGIVGLVLGVGFVVAASITASGPLAWMAAGIAIGWLVEPAPVGTLALAALLLGASSCRLQAEPLLGSSNAARVAASIAVGLGAILGSWYFVGDAAVDLSPEGEETGDPVTWWYSLDPAVAGLISRELAIEAPGRGDEPATRWARIAVEREPDLARWHAELALRQLQTDDVDGAHASSVKALELQPNDPLGLKMLLFVGQRTGDDALVARATAGLCDLGMCP